MHKWSVDGVFMWTIHCERDDFVGQVEVRLFRLNHNLRILGSAILALNVLNVWSRLSLYEYRLSIRTAETSNTSNGVEVDIYMYISNVNTLIRYTESITVSYTSRLRKNSVWYRQVCNRGQRQSPAAMRVAGLRDTLPDGELNVIGSQICDARSRRCRRLCRGLIHILVYLG